MKPNNKIIISTEIRPCYVMVNTEDRHRAFFHCWTCEREQYGEYSAIKVFALCEFENGSLKKIEPENICFADGGSFGEYCFVPYEELQRLGDDDRC